ncbi:50S ribosomal protein L25 [Paenibacillus chartarius]|uniref:Large ribosomal subunit protein bL25 n=1 Tax=Paenibacillus chartarius TaxID=747481 RepID=A0ABV6DTZ3_9BACL
MTISLKAEARDGLTKAEVKFLRREGKIPAVVYGKKVGSTSLLIDQKDLNQLLRSNRHAIVELDVPGSGTQPVMLSDVQRDKVTRELLHVDFHQINMDEPVRATVPLEFVGEAAGVKEGGMLQTILHELEVRCLPRDLPATLQIDVSELQLGESFLVSSIQLPAGLELKAEPDQPVVTVLAPQKAGTDEEIVDKESAGEPVAGAPTEADKVGETV